MTVFLHRELTPLLTAALEQLPVVVVSGLRQSGKSTLLTRDDRFRDRQYLTLDDFAAQAAAESDPESLLESSGDITIDEVQRVPGMLPAIKVAVDRARRAGHFLLSGSANLALMARVSESLAGRAVYLTLHPMTRREIHGDTARTPSLARFLEGKPWPKDAAEPIREDEVLRGGMPPVCLDAKSSTSLWFRGYVQTYVERDIRQLSQVADLIAFRTLVNLAALRTAQILNASSLARDAKLSSATVVRYLHLLETSFLIRRVPPFLSNRSSRLIKSPKLYFTDSGLAAYLAQSQTMDGALLETWVMNNVSAILDAHLPDAKLSFWHEQGRHEVDIVIESGRAVWAIEIKAAARWSDSDLSGLRAFLERTPQCVAAILAYNGKTTVALGPKLWAVPLGHLVA